MGTDFPIEELRLRRPVWEALAGMFLDTDVSLDRDSRVARLAASPYPIDELERILIDEVYPVCGRNLRVVAGVWSGFDPKWLEHEIRRRRAWPLRLLAPFHLGRFTMPRFDEWQATRAGVHASRTREA